MRQSGAILILAICLPACCCGMFADQAGVHDWRQRFVGAARFARFDQSSQSSRRVLLATGSGVLASINARTGQLGWRQVFGADDNIITLQHRGNVLVTLSSGGQRLRGWDVATGGLAWEALVAEDQPQTDQVSSAVLVESKSGKSTAIAVLLGDQLQLFSSKSGQRLWGVTVSESSLKCQFIHATAGQLHAIGVTNGVDVTIITYQATSGDVASQHTLPAAWVSSKPLDCIVIGSSFLVCYDPVTASLQTALLDVESSTFVATSLRSLGFVESEGALESVSLRSLNLESGTSASSAPLPPSMQMYFLLGLAASSQFLLRVDESSAAVTLVREFSKPNLQLYPAVYGDKEYLLMLEHDASRESLSLEWLDLGNTQPASELSQEVHLPSHHGPPTDACIYLFSKKDSSLGYRILLQTADDALSLVQQSPRLIWTREEALASVVSSELVELPISNSESYFETLHEEFGTATSNVLSAFVQRVASQLVQVQHWLSSLHGHKLSHSRKSDSSGDGEETPQREDFLRDQFNLHRMIVVATSVGKLFGIDSRDGSIIWQLFPRGIRPFRPGTTLPSPTAGAEESYQLVLLRSVQHFPLEPLAVLLADSKSAHCTTAALLFFNPMTGKVLSSEPSGYATTAGQGSLGWSCLPFRPVTSVLLPTVDSSARRVMAMLDHEQQVHLLPSVDSAEQIFRSISQAVHMYVATRGASVVKGYQLALSEDKKLTAVPSWRMNIPEDEVVVSTVGKTHKEVINSLGSVMANGSVHYKYLNPNLVAVVTESQDAHSPSVSVYLMDSVTGATVYHAQHKSLHGPVNLVHTDNWLVYSTFQGKIRRHEVNVVELYDGLTQPSTEPFSSLSAPASVTVMAQSYIFRGVINTMAVSYTRRGVANRGLLFGLENGGVLSLLKFFVNPRREMVPTGQEPEGTMPYVPELPYDPRALINYNQSVACVRHIKSVPSGLESTSLVFAHGLDLFFTRLMPSKTFDVLPADFDRPFIIAILLLLATVSFVSSRLSARKALKHSWQ